MAEKYEINFKWPHPEPRDVIVTGTFDQWSSSVHLTRGVDGFEGKVFVPWGERVLYKFVVDGQWTNHDDQPKEADHEGNINNVYQAPTKPAPPQGSLNDNSSATPSTTQNGVADSEKPPLKNEQELPPVENVSVPDVTQSPIAAPAIKGETIESASAPPAAKVPQNTASGTPPLAMAGIPLTTEGEAFVPVAHSADDGAESPSQKGTSTVPGAANHAVNAAEATESTPKPATEPEIPSMEQVPATAVAPEVAKEPTVDASSAPSGQNLPIPAPAAQLSEAVVPTSASKAGEESPEAVPPTPQQAAVAVTTPVQATEPTAEKGVETANEPLVDSKAESERPATPPPVYTNVSPSTPQKGESSKTETPAATPSAPSTPANKHIFPSGGTVEDSGGSSKFGSQRKKRASFFGKLKSVFGGDKEKI